MMCWCTVSDFSSFILLFCTLATVYFCFFLFCLFVLFMGGGVAFVSSLRRENSNVFSDWEGCGVTNDINERLMQTHIIFFYPFPKCHFFKRLFCHFDKIMLRVVPDWHSTMIHSIKWWNNLKQIFGFFFVKILGVGKNELQLWKSSVFANKSNLLRWILFKFQSLL